MAFSVKVMIHNAKEGGYWAEVPALPGCVSQGETKKEMLENIREAITLHLEAISNYKPSQPKKAKYEIATVSVSA